MKLGYYFVHNIKDSQCPYTDDEKVIISKIYRLGFQSFKPLVVTLCSHLKYENLRLELFQYIEKYIFTRFNIEFFPSGKGSTDFYHFANRFQEVKEKKENEVYLKLVLDLIKRITYDFDKDNLWHLISKKFVEKVLGLDEKFYKWKGLCYFLYEYEIYLQEQHCGELKVEWEHIKAETIEHIFPQTPKDNYPAFENQDLLHDLGNLLLLARKTNSKLSNKSFTDKKALFSTDSYSAIEISKSENWTANEILARRKKMLEFMDERWDIEISDTVIKLLDIDET